MDKNKTLLTVISVIFIIGFLLIVYQATNKEGARPEITPNAVLSKEIAQVRKDDHTKWATDSAHVLIKYSDLQCPACRSFWSVLKPLEADADILKNITFVYRHFPLRTVHPNAQAAAQATEAAGRQDKFYEMHDILFETQETWAKMGNPEKFFIEKAGDLELDIEQFRKDFDSKEIKDKIEADFQSGVAAGVNSTPTFYLDGKKVNVESFPQFVELLQKTGQATN